MVKSNDLKLTLCAGIALAGMLLPASVFAGTETASKEVTPVVAETKSAITGDFGVQFVSAYFSRGILQGGATYTANQGVIAQPYADLYFDLYDGKDTDFVNKVSLNLGIWGSIHSHHPGVVSTTPAWQEFDWMPGISVTFAKNFTLTTSYYEFDSPSDQFASFRGVNANLSYNDSDLLKAFALHPHVSYLREIENKAGIGTNKGNYYEVGVTPGLPAYGPLSVTFPIAAGFGSAGFYGPETGFGYLSAGVNATVAMSFVPSKFGAWSFTTGATYLKLNGATKVADLGRAYDWVFNGGVGGAF